MKKLGVKQTKVKFISQLVTGRANSRHRSRQQKIPEQMLTDFPYRVSVKLVSGVKKKLHPEPKQPKSETGQAGATCPLNHDSRGTPPTKSAPKHPTW